MKKTYYLFNPGQLERKDNTLKFTPVVEDGNGEESVGAPRYLPVEDINEFYGDYQAGEVAEQRNPLVNFTEGDLEATVISDKEGK